MEKDILIQNLRTKVGEDDCKVISDKTFDGIAESVLPMFADDSKITDDSWKLPIAALKQFAGQKRFDEKEFTEKYKTEYASQHEKDVEGRISKAVADALEKYKKEHPEKTVEDEGKDKDKDKDGQDLEKKISDLVTKAMAGITGEGSEFSKLTATITTFLKTQEEREKTGVKNQVKKALKEHIMSLKANNEACVDDALDDIDYGDNPTFDGLKQTAIAAYEKRYKRYYADGGKPFGGSGSGGGGDEGSDSFVKDRLEKLKKEAQDSADYAKEQEKTFC